MRAKKGKGKNKFLPPFERKKAEKLLYIFEPLKESGYSMHGVIESLEDILQRPSSIRKCSVVCLEEVFKAIDRV